MAGRGLVWGDLSPLGWRIGGWFGRILFWFGIWSAILVLKAFYLSVYFTVCVCLCREDLWKNCWWKSSRPNLGNPFYLGTFGEPWRKRNSSNSGWLSTLPSYPATAHWNSQSEVIPTHLEWIKDDRDQWGHIWALPGWCLGAWAGD